MDHLKKKKRTKAEIEKEGFVMGDMYALLDIERGSNFEMDEATIAKAYRKVAVQFHPDKLGANITAKDKEVWLKIQNAYETLIDPSKKKKYDSTLPFDDKIPTMEECKTDADFYELFGACFNLNATFSEVKPVPELGDHTTDLKDVRAFYSFWDAFKTWREFAQYDEYDLEDAQDRYEKRWMDKQNAKLRKEYEKAERKRLWQLVNRAYENDPRIKNQAALEKAEKDAIKQAKKDAIANRYKERDEQIAKEKELAAQRLIEEEEAKKAALALKREAGKKYRQTVKDFIMFLEQMMPETKYDRWFAEEYVKKFPQQDKLDEIFAKCKALDEDDFFHQFDTMITEGTPRASAEHLKEKEANGTETKKWSAEDITKLTAAIVRFPPGTSERWKVIADFIGKDQKATIKQAKDLEAK